MAFKFQKYAALLLALSFNISINGQSPVTVEYPFQTVTWYVNQELVTATIQAHTQIDTVLGFVTTNTIPDTTYTDNNGRQMVTRTISGATLTRINPDVTIIQSLPQETITRSLWYSTTTETLLKKTATYIPTSGETLDYYTITGPTFGNSYIFTVIESFDHRSAINTIPGPTITYVVGDRDPVTATVENGALTTVYDNPITVLETFGPTRVTRNIDPKVSTSIGTGSLTYTPSSSNSVSVSVTTATVTVTPNTLTSSLPSSSNTSNSGTSNSASVSSASITSVSEHTSASTTNHSRTPTDSHQSTPTSKPTKCIPKPKKCTPTTKYTNCN
ncbi:hypothetical protein K7432_007780 [Basidiobolus ranarum]|uniref:Uncharacterized protein n=1 Tax=Basidiobolus ranarum TaxID=34480 RepID=A0ABR2VZM7_9FUNG